MRIEKVNDNQIRCVLSKEDLEGRQIKLSELAYGSEKAKGLFREMIQQASYEVGFEADDVPLMVEAIPVSADAIVLVITKVEYPEELDTRFSKFTDPEDDMFDKDSQDMDFPRNVKGADDILDLFYKQTKAVKDKTASEEKDKEEESADSKTASLEQKVEKKQQETVLPNIAKMFEFTNLEQVERLAVVLEGFYNGENALYKNEKKNHYFLTVHKSDHSPVEFNKVCNIISEYATQRNYTPAVGAHFEEHCKVILSKNALQTLASLNA